MRSLASFTRRLGPAAGCCVGRGQRAERDVAPPDGRGELDSELDAPDRLERPVVAQPRPAGFRLDFVV